MKLVLILLLLCNACIHNQELKNMYFKEYNLPKNILPASLVLIQAKEYEKIQKFIYGNNAHELIKCALLRNQFYIASLKSSDNKIKELAWHIEEAYQSSDKEFLQQCKSLQQTSLGREFLQAQTNYLQSY